MDASLRVDKELVTLTNIFWRHATGQSFEHCQFDLGEEISISGEIVGNLQGMWGALTYEIHCWPDGSTRLVRGRVQHQDGVLTWLMSRDTGGVWLVNGEPHFSLDLCQDVDIGVTPSTNTLPIRRLGLHVGAAVACSSAWLRFPDLTVHALPQRYTRLSSDVYRYESLSSGFQTTLQVDKQGIVQEYHGLWTRLFID